MTLDQSQLDEVLGAVGAGVRRDHARRKQRRLAVLVATVAAAVFSSVAIAGTLSDWWTNAQPPVDPAAVDSTARDNAGVIAIDLTKKALVASTPDSKLDAVATKSGGYCLIAFHDGKGIDSSCDDTPVKDDGTASRYSSRTSEPTAPDSARWWIGYGRITDARAASIDLSSVGLSSDLPLQRGGFFLFDIAPSQWTEVDNRVGALVIRDSAGATIRTGCIDVGLAPGKMWSGGGGIGDAGDNCDDYKWMPPPTIDYDSAQKVAELTLLRDHGSMFVDGKQTATAGLTVGLWQTHDSAGETCWLYAAASERPTRAIDDNGVPVLTGNPGRTLDCLKPNSDVFTAHKIVLGLDQTLTPAANAYATMVTGVVDPSLGAARVTLNADDGHALPLTFGGNAFIAELPDAPKAGDNAGPIPGGPYTVNAYDASGQLVATQRLQEKPPRGKYEK